MGRTPYNDFVDAIANLVDYHKVTFEPGAHPELKPSVQKDSYGDAFVVPRVLDEVARSAVQDTLRQILTQMDEWRESGLLEVRWRGELLPVKPHGKSLGRDVIIQQNRYRERNRCPLHLKALRRGLAEVLYGYPPSIPASYRRAEKNLFPWAEPYCKGGCCVRDRMPWYYKVTYCPDCRAALCQWLQSHRPHFYLGQEGWDRIRRDYRKYLGTSREPVGR